MIKFKRQDGGSSSDSQASPPSSLAYGEPAIASDGTFYVGNGSGEVVSKVNNAKKAESAKNGSYTYYGVFTLSNWKDADLESKTNGYNFTQTVKLIPEDESAPKVTQNSSFVTGCGFTPTGVSSTDEILSDTLSIINAGISQLENDTVITLVSEKPTSDIQVRWNIKVEVDE